MATKYVSLTGSDAAAGDLATPWLTIAFAVAQLVAGDTLYIRAGVYTGSSNTIRSGSTTIRSGTSFSNAITIAGYTAETVTIQVPNGIAAIELIGGHSYLIVQDLIIDGINDTSGGPSALIYHSTGTNHIRYQRVEVKRGYRNGIQFSASGGTSDYNEVLSCVLHDNGRQPTASNAGYGAYVQTGNNLFDGNSAYNNHGYGLHFNNSSTLTINNNIIRNNRLYNNTVNDVGPGTGGLTGGGLVIVSGDGNLIYNNLVYNNGVGGPSGSASNGILVYNYTTNTKVYNNTVYGNTGDGIALQYYDGAPTVKNNIAYGNGGGSIVDYGGTGSPVLSNNLTTDPTFVDAANGNFALLVGSPAIDAGATLADVTSDFEGTSRPVNAVYDIGAYEYPSAGTAAAVVSGSFASDVLFIPHDGQTNRGTLVNTTTGAITDTTLDVVKSEFGAVLSSGIVGLKDNVADSLFVVYATDLTPVASLSVFAGTWPATSPVGSDYAHTFYVSKRNSAVGQSQVKTVSDGGAVGSTTWTLDVGHLNSLSVNTAGTILYYADNVVGAPVRRWDLVNNVALSHLVPTGTTNLIGTEGVLVLPSSGDVLVIYKPVSTVADWNLYRYGADGTLHWTYALGNAVPNGDDIRISLDVADPRSFWLRTFPDLTLATTRFQRIDIATGTIHSQFDVALGGTTGVPASCSMFSVTGPSHSDHPSQPCCPPIPGSNGAAGAGGGGGSCDCPAPTGSQPTGTSAPGSPGAILPPISIAWTPMCAGGGTVPTAADLTDAENWAY